METKKTLGEVIERKRKELGLSQRELARKVHLNNATISRIEAMPEITADPKTLKEISSALKLDYNYLLSLNKTIDDDAELRMIARATKKMSDEEKQEMMQTLRSMFREAFSGVESDDLDAN